jgi:hypothetical protein
VGRKFSKFVQSKLILCAIFWGQKSRLAQLAIFLHGWRLIFRAKFRGWRGEARLAETSSSLVFHSSKIYFSPHCFEPKIIYLPIIWQPAVFPQFEVCKKKPVETIKKGHSTNTPLLFKNCKKIDFVE